MPLQDGARDAPGDGGGFDISASMPSGWQPSTGDWQVLASSHAKSRPNVLRGSSPGGLAVLVSPGERTGGASVAASIWVAPGAAPPPAGLVLGHSGPGDFTAVLLDAGKSVVRVEAYAEGDLVKSSEAVVSPVRKSAWVTLGARWDGGPLLVTLDSHEVLRDEAPISDGALGVCLKGPGEADFDDVEPA